MEPAKDCNYIVLQLFFSYNLDSLGRPAGQVLFNEAKSRRSARNITPVLPWAMFFNVNSLSTPLQPHSSHVKEQADLARRVSLIKTSPLHVQIQVYYIAWAWKPSVSSEFLIKILVQRVYARPHPSSLTLSIIWVALRTAGNTMHIHLNVIVVSFVEK